MTRELANFLTVGLGCTEIAVYSLAGMGALRHCGHTLAEAAAGAALLPAILMSFLLPFSGLAGFPAPIMVMRLCLLVLAFGLIWRFRRRLLDVRGPVWRFAGDHPLAVGALGISIGALLAASVMMGGNRGDLSMPHFGTSATFSGCQTSSLPAVIGTGICFPGAVLLPWMAYLTICLATYALARRYAWSPTAITVTLLVASMPRLVLLAVSRSLEVMPAAAALLSILLLYRTVERPKITDLILFVTVVAFSISGERMGLVFPLIGCGLAVLVLYRRHGGRLWWDLVRAAPWSATTAGAVTIVLAIGGFRGGTVTATAGHAIPWSYNADGLMGTLANLMRYGLQMIDLTPPVENALRQVVGFDWPAARLWIHDHLLAAVFQSKGAAAAFTPAVSGANELVWFGPLAGLLMPPALGWALMRGPRRLKSVALALVGYFSMVVLIPAWLPANVRYFTVFFVCSGFTAAFLLPPWRMTRRRRRFLQSSALALMAYGVGAVFRIW